MKPALDTRERLIREEIEVWEQRIASALSDLAYFQCALAVKRRELAEIQRRRAMYAKWPAKRRQIGVTR